MLFGAETLQSESTSAPDKATVWNADRSGKVMCKASTVPLVTSTVSVPENGQISPKRGAWIWAETKIGRSILSSTLDKELFDGIGSRRSSQRERDQRSRTRLREAAQRQTEEFFSPHICSLIYLNGGYWAKRKRRGLFSPAGGGPQSFSPQIGSTAHTMHSIPLSEVTTVTLTAGLQKHAVDLRDSL